MKKLYIHAGFHKTATTYLQQFLKKNRDVFSQQLLYYLDKSYCRKPWVHHVLPVSIRKIKHPAISISEPREALWGRFVDAVHRCQQDRILISSEVFLEGVDREFLGEALASLDVTFVFYVRRQDEFFASHYAEKCKHGCSDSVTESLNRWRHNRGFGYLRRIQAFERIAPSTKVIVREYNRSLFPAGDIARDLLNAIGVQLSEADCERLQDVKAQNLRWPSEFVELLTQFNGLPVSYAEKSAFRRYLIELIGREPAVSKLTSFQIDARLKREILEMAAESNLRLVRQYPVDGEFFNETAILESRRKTA